MFFEPAFRPLFLPVYSLPFLPILVVAWVVEAWVLVTRAVAWVVACEISVFSVTAISTEFVDCVFVIVGLTNWDANFSLS